MAGTADRLVTTNRVFGPVWTLHAAAALMVGRLPGLAELGERLMPDGSLERARFDRRYGVDTDGFDWEILKEFGDDLEKQGLGYEGADERHVKHVLAMLPDTGPSTEFWDLGSGKGKAVFVAATTGRFAKVVGVELGAYLVETAERNTPTFRERATVDTEIEWHLQSATEAALPTDRPLVVYMHNPFFGDPFVQTCDLLEATARESDHPVHLVYASPSCHDEIERRGWPVLTSHEAHPYWFSWNIYRVPGSG